MGARRGKLYLSIHSFHIMTDETFTELAEKYRRLWTIENERGETVRNPNVSEVCRKLYNQWRTERESVDGQYPSAVRPKFLRGFFYDYYGIRVHSAEDLERWEHPDKEILLSYNGIPVMLRFLYIDSTIIISQPDD